MARYLITLLGSSKQNCDWHIFTVSILFVDIYTKYPEIETFSTKNMYKME